jgi:plastocyanin
MRGELAGKIIGALVLAIVAGSADAEVIQIRVEKLAFSPAQVTARVGDTIEWVNADFIAHTATARNGAWDVLLPANTSERLILKSAGAVDYYCKFHPGMVGKISIAE